MWYSFVNQDLLRGNRHVYLHISDSKYKCEESKKCRKR